jgi:hypothetical protein
MPSRPNVPEEVPADHSGPWRVGHVSAKGLVEHRFHLRRRDRYVRFGGDGTLWGSPTKFAGPWEAVPKALRCRYCGKWVDRPMQPCSQVRGWCRALS